MRSSPVNKTPEKAFEKLKKIHDTWKAMARALNHISETLSSQTIALWRERRTIPAEYIICLEKHSIDLKSGKPRIKREEMRPDLYIV